jgi:hypothetical protein
MMASPLPPLQRLGEGRPRDGVPGVRRVGWRPGDAPHLPLRRFGVIHGITRIIGVGNWDERGHISCVGAGVFGVLFGVDLGEDASHRFGEAIRLVLLRLAALAGGGDGGAGEAGDTEGEAARVLFLGKQAGEGIADGADLVVEVLLFGGLGDDAGEGGVEEVLVLAVGDSPAELVCGFTCFASG